MLKLTRRIGETIILETSDGQIEVEVVQVNGRQVRLGFDAPDSVNILRKEVAERNRLDG